MWNSYSPLVGQNLDPLTQIQVTVGASEGLMAAINGVVAPGDEVIGTDQGFVPLELTSI